MRNNRPLLPVLFLAFVLPFLAGSPSVGQEICPLNGQPMKPKALRSFETLERMAILENGRLKPLDTYARNLLLLFSGKTTFERKPAIEWLAKLLFAPELTRQDKVFLVNNPEILASLSVEPDKKRRYTFEQLSKGFDKLTELAHAASAIEAKDRSVVDTEILRLHHNLSLYADLSQSFAFAFPHPDFEIKNPQLKAKLELPAGQQYHSYTEIVSRSQKIYELSSGLEKKQDPSSWTDEERDIFRLLHNLFAWSQSIPQLPMTIVPAYAHIEDERWLNPWQAFSEGFQTEPGKIELKALADLPISYWNGDQLKFDLSLRSFSDSLKKRISPDRQKVLNRFPLELTYNKAGLYLWSRIFYGLAFLVFLISLISERKVLYTVATGLTIAAVIPHFVALTLRCIILARPPVSNLFETFIFVALVSALIGLLLERINKDWVGLVVASVCGFIFLSIAGKFSAEGDTLQMLIAVLDSNFWLSTHVISITVGYAGSCVAGVIGHIYILQALSRTKDKKSLEKTYQALLGTLGFGLALTFLGTNLGGIWADQSWGRFWGWDPKENGALMIVLWTAIILHAKIGRMIGALGVAVMSALLIIVVMWAWFGVNLLSVGLHSYGFTSGIAMNLVIYLILQIAFLAITVPIAAKRLQQNAS